MRAAVRPLLVFVLLLSSASVSQSDNAPGGGVNSVAFNRSSPAPTSGGVDVAVTQQPTVGYTCTRVTIRVLDNATGATLASYSVENPAAGVSKSFVGLGNNKEVQVTVDAVFRNGVMFDFKSIQSVVTTK